MQNQSEETKAAIMALNIENIKGSVIEIKTDIKELKGIYATKEELREVAKEVTAIGLLTGRVVLLENNKSFLAGGWKTITIFVAVIAGVVALVLNALKLFRAGL